MTLRRLSIRSLAFAAALVVAVQLATPTAAHAAVVSTLTLNASPNAAKIGDHIDLSGQLTFEDMSSSAGQTITLTRDDAAGTHALPDATTGSDGTYSANDVVDVGGSVT